MVHPHETHVEHVHEAIPQAAYLSAARLSIAVRLQVEHAFDQRSEEVLDLPFAPVVHLPRFDELFSEFNEEVAKLP